jgi:hypothetical protein
MVIGRVARVHIGSGGAQSGDGYAGHQRYAVNILDRSIAQKLSDGALRLTGLGREVSGSMVRPSDAFAA